MPDPKPRIRVTDPEFKNPQTPYSEEYRDVYFSPESGVDESRYIYLEGSGLLASLNSEKKDFQVAEIGFGVGLNFILTLDAFKKSGKTGTLRYFSFENRPVKKSALRTLYQSISSLSPFSAPLLAEYPEPTPGIHLLRFLNGSVSLYLCFGDASEMLSRIDFKADHWFWDGFAPSRNPDAFSESLFSEVARHSSPRARGASFTSAGWVRRALESQGFRVAKRPGFGHKRECIEAEYLGEESAEECAPWFSRKNEKPLNSGMRVAVVGAGLGGTAIARALAERGHSVTVIDPRGIAGRASSNPVGLFNVQLSKIPNFVSRFSQLSLIHFLRELDRLGLPSKRGILRTDLHDPLPLLHSDYPSEFFETRAEGTYFPLCGMIDPRELCRLRMDHPNITLIKSALSSKINHDSDIELFLLGRESPIKVDHVVYALGADPKLDGPPRIMDPNLEAMPTRPVRGQIIFVSPVDESESLSHSLVEEGYATPLVEGVHVIGATYQAKSISPDQEEQDTRALLEAAKKWRTFESLKESHFQGLKTGYRMSTPDKLPMVGPLCNPEWLKSTYSKSLLSTKTTRPGPPLQSPPGEWVLTGLGSRGITYSSYSAEILSEWMCGAPLPVEKDILWHLHPARFFIRNLRRAAIR